MTTKTVIRTFDDHDQEVYEIKGSGKILTPNEFEKLKGLMPDVQWLTIHVVQPWEYPVEHPGFQRKTKLTYNYK